MANINTPISATATETQADDTAQNPTTVTSTGVPGNQVVHLSLVFKGINVDPAAIYDMVDAQYGTVASIKGTVARGTYIYVIET